jgi:hypothetical protein
LHVYSLRRSVDDPSQCAEGAWSAGDNNATRTDLADGARGAGVGRAVRRRQRAGAAPATSDNAVMLTIFLKHDQSRPLAELNAQLEKQGFYKAFPPEGIEVVSWNIVMGIGQVVTLRLPASRLREVNRIFETTAWGAYRTEYYATYDYKAIGIANHEKAMK